MNTLVDFITQNKGIEYLLAIGFIAGYALFVEFLNKKPFSGMVTSLAEDVRHIRAEGKADIRKLMKNMVVLPFVAGAYLMALPFYMMVGLLLKAESGLSSVVGGGSMTWRPLESYLTGRGKKRSSRKVKETEGTDESA